MNYVLATIQTIVQWLSFFKNFFSKIHELKKYVFFVTCVALGILGVYFYKFTWELSYNPSDWGDFGSYIGGTLGTFFAFCSFMALLYTIYIQKEELTTAIKALNKSAEAQNEQAKTFEIQRFESTFYSLLELHNRTLNELNADPDAYNTSRILTTSMVRISKNEAINSPEEKLKIIQSFILEKNKLSQYFRVLYQLLKFIVKHSHNSTSQVQFKNYISDINTVTGSEKMYASIVRSFVPVDLLPVLALNCIPSYEGLNNLDIYWSIIERYKFLEHMRFDQPPKLNFIAFSIMSSYSYAFGENHTLQDKLQDIHCEFSTQYDEFITEGSALHTYKMSHCD